jgi:hypothetical protein
MEESDEHKRMRLDINSRHLSRYQDNVITFCNGSSQVMKPGFSIVNLK